MKKKIIIIIIIIVIIAIGLIFAGSILLKNIEKPQKEVIQKLDTDEETKFTSEVLTKVSSLEANLYQKFPIDDLEKLDDTTKTKFILDVVSASSKEVTVKQVQAEAKKYFNNFSIVKKDIKVDKDAAYTYKNNTYTKNITVGNRCSLKTNVISKNKVNDNYIVKSKYYYINGSKNSVEDLEATIKVYKTLKDCEDKTSEILSITNKTIGISNEDYEKIKEQLNTYVYTISKDYKVLSIKSE